MLVIPNSSSHEYTQPPVATSSPENGDGPNSTSANGVSISTTAGSSPDGKHRKIVLELKNYDSDPNPRSVAFLLFV